MAKGKEANVQEYTDVAPAKASSYLKHCMRVGRPVFLWGSPGIGKSEVIEQIAREQGRMVIDLRLILMGPEDLKGIPYFDSLDGTMRFAPSSELPEVVTQADVDEVEEVFLATEAGLNFVRSLKGEIPDDEYAKRFADSKKEEDKARSKRDRTKGCLDFQDAILFLDEMNSAPPSVQGAAYQLTLNRKIGEYTLPEGVSIVAAGNKDTDKGVTYRMPTPLANRFIHLYMDVEFEDWQDWAINDAVHPDVLGFLTAHPTKLHQFNPKSPHKAFATPRSWVFVSQLLEEEMDHEMARTLIGGTIGEGLAIEFMSHRKVAAKMPNPMDILLGKVKTLNVEDVSARYSLTISMCYLLKEIRERITSEDHPDVDDKYYIDCYDNYLEYLMDVMQEEMVILGATTALKTYKLPLDRNKSRSFSKMFSQYGKMVLNT